MPEPYDAKVSCTVLRGLTIPDSQTNSAMIDLRLIKKDKMTDKQFFTFVFL
jgi:hypothetical protein